MRVDALVTNEGKILNGLTKDDFVVTDEDKVQPLVACSQEAQPLSLILLLDVSGSMQKWLDQIAKDARDALKHLSAGDRVAVIVFGKRSEVHQEFSDNLAETARQISTAERAHDVGSGTAINQAVLDSAEYMDRHASAQSRRAILILTDNLSISYMLPDGKVIRELEKADTSLNAIVVGRAIRPAPLQAGHYTNPDFTPADVFHLAEATGGEAVKSSEAGQSFNEMVERIRLRYTLAYHEPEGAVSGSYRHIRVQLSAIASRRYPLAEIHARNGYWVP